MADDKPKQAPTRKKSLSKKLGEYLKLASDVALIIMDLRDRPTKWDLYGVGLRATNLGLDWYKGRSSRGHMSVYEYFDGGDWVIFPQEYKEHVIQLARNAMVADEFLDSDEKSEYCCLAYIGKEEVGWTICNGEVISGPFYHEKRQWETMALLSEQMWKHFGGKQLCFDGLRITRDTVADKNIIATVQMDGLLNQISKYLKANVNRSYLLTGAPGTGKSVAIRWLAAVLNMKSLRVNIGSLNENATVTTSLRIALNIMKPDVLILDDLDRVEVDADVLAFLEHARTACKLVIASANHEFDLSGAALRPGRLDELIQFKLLDKPVVERMLGEFADLADKVWDLPAAYVSEFRDRCKVLGREEALSGLDKLRARAKETSMDSDDYEIDE